MSATIKKTQTDKVYIGNVDSYILLLFLVYGLFSQYLFLSLLGGIAFIVIVRSLWKPYTPAVLLFFVMFHWVQVFSSLLYADVSGLSFDTLYRSKDTEFLFSMTLLQLIVMTMLLQQFLSRTKTGAVNLEVLKKAAEKINTRNVIIGYFAMLVIMPALISFARNSSSLLQLVSSFSIIKQVFVGLLIFTLLLKKTENRLLIIAMLIFDFILSFASFFSDFKVILIMSIIIYYTVHPYLKKVTAYRMVPVVALLVIFFSFWSYLKGSYRSFLNQGSKEQVVAVSNTEALKYLFAQIGDLNTTALTEGLTLFIQRAQYMERYAEVYARVPEKIPHRDGADLAESIEFLLVPRFINEDKGVKDASQRTSYYTGKNFSKASQGTSISMGYFCDLYIDYGLYLMVIPLLLITALIGALYQKILNIKRYNILFIYSLLVGTFLTLGTFESDSIFFLGILRNNIAFLVLGYFTFFPLLHKFIFAKAK